MAGPPGAAHPRARGRAARGVAILPLLATVALLVPSALAEEGEETDEGYPVTVVAERVALDEPVASYPAPVSALRYDPRVDLQSRNTAEAQGDIAIRGGIFEDAALVVGAVTLVDPQTGHYLGSLPVPTHMLEGPEVLTGVHSTLAAMQATSGAVRWTWRPVRDGGEVTLAGGLPLLHREHARAARTFEVGARTLGVDLDAAHAAGVGTVEGGDSRAWRVAGRVQLAGPASQTDVFWGFEDRFVSWPNLYALAELHELIETSGIETDTTRTHLVLAGHHQRWEGGEVRVDGALRRLASDYELDRDQPGLYDDYAHTSWVGGLGAAAHHALGPVRLAATAQVMRDDLESTALTRGETRRTLARAALLPEVDLALGAWHLRPAAGAAVDTSSDVGVHLSPLARLAVEREGEVTGRAWVEAAGASRVPGYTASASSPEFGLFRGLEGEVVRQRTLGWEAGLAVASPRLGLSGAVFRRTDADLVDWVHAVDVEPYASRQAMPLDVVVQGAEVAGWARVPHADLTLAWTGLAKEAEYATDTSSFYAMNFPRHRATAAVVLRPWPWLDLRADNEVRVQEPNALRSGPDTAWLASAAVRWRPAAAPGTSLTLLVDDLADARFEEVPGVPGSGRQGAVVLGYAW